VCHIFGKLRLCNLFNHIHDIRTVAANLFGSSDRCLISCQMKSPILNSGAPDLKATIKFFLKLCNLGGIPISRCDRHRKESSKCSIVGIEILHLPIVCMVTSRIHKVQGILAEPPSSWSFLKSLSPAMIPKHLKNLGK
jgi:hypothetical protein